MKDTFLDFQNPGVSYSSKKSPMFHSYWGLCRVFVEPALAWNLLLQYISWGHLGHLCDLQPLSFSQSLQCNQPYTKIPTTLLPPKNKIEISPCFPLYTYTILYPITYTKKTPCEKKEKNKTAPKKSEQNSCDRPVTPLILRPGVILSTVSLGGPTNWLIFCCRGISCFEIVSLCRNYPCWWRLFVNNYKDVLTFALNNN